MRTHAAFDLKRNERHGQGEGREPAQERTTPMTSPALIGRCPLLSSSGASLELRKERSRLGIIRLLWQSRDTKAGHRFSGQALVTVIDEVGPPVALLRVATGASGKAKSFIPGTETPMGLGTKNRQKQTADLRAGICGKNIRINYQAMRLFSPDFGFFSIPRAVPDQGLATDPA